MPEGAAPLIVGCISACSTGLATLISIPQLIGALGGARNALATLDVLQNLGINIGAVTIFGLLFRSDWQVCGGCCMTAVGSSTWLYGILYAAKESAEAVP